MAPSPQSRRSTDDSCTWGTPQAGASATYYCGGLRSVPRRSTRSKPAWLASVVEKSDESIRNCALGADSRRLSIANSLANSPGPHTTTGPTSKTYGATDSFSGNQVLITNAAIANGAHSLRSRQSARIPIIHDRRLSGHPTAWRLAGSGRSAVMGPLAKAGREFDHHPAIALHIRGVRRGRLQEDDSTGRLDPRSSRRESRPEAAQSWSPANFH
jgi:hypothetical protein